MPLGTSVAAFDFISSMVTVILADEHPALFRESVALRSLRILRTGIFDFDPAESL